MDKQEVLRSLPRVDDLLLVIKLRKELESVPYDIIKEQTRQAVANLRSEITKGEISQIPTTKVIEEQIVSSCLKICDSSLQKLINATGIVLHTNLGRAALAKSVVENIQKVAVGYSNLEYDLNSGGRGSRQTHIEALLQRITRAQAALVVNNNAAAVMLILSSLCKGKEVIVSRGELVEIGGSFRVPEIMSLSGAILKEVGTTNKTKLFDYKQAIDSQNTAALLKVHTSNFKIVGFHQSVDISSLAALGREYNIPTIYDLGSGLLSDKIKLENEDSVQDCIRAGADIVSFSGDKLLGGPQAGIIIGKKKYIDIMKSHPLYRSLRVDKLCLAALESTLLLYLDQEKAASNIPTLKALSMTQEKLNKHAQNLLSLLKNNNGYKARVVKSEGQVGGGSAPGEALPSYVVEITPTSISAAALEQKLRNYQTPIITRIQKDKVLLDVRTISDAEFAVIAQAFAAIFC